jgi:heme/copper-type cytochrome/quinol oxidase subunit 3
VEHTAAAAPGGTLADAGHALETSTGEHHNKILIWTFLGSECMLFGTLITTFLVYWHRSDTGPHPRDVLNIPYTSVSAFVLLVSSLAMVLALAALQRGDHRGTRVWLVATALLGAIFLGGQYFEFTTFYHHEMTLEANLFGSAFFMLTGTHGAHVTVGVIWLLSLFVISLRGQLPSSKSLNVEIAGLYWHFVDVAWIVIFTVVYLIPTSVS